MTKTTNNQTTEKATKIGAKDFRDTILKAFKGIAVVGSKNDEVPADDEWVMIHFYMPDSKKHYFGMYPNSRHVRVSLSTDAAALLAESDLYTVQDAKAGKNIMFSHADAVAVSEILLQAKKDAEEAARVKKAEKKAKMAEEKAKAEEKPAKAQKTAAKKATPKKGDMKSAK